MTYLITFSCYGSRLHGNESGSVDRNHNVFGHRILEPDETRMSRERRLMDQAPYVLHEASRSAVLEAIRDVCRYREWRLLAAHVRSTHVHVVAETEDQPEKAMNAFNSYASRRLSNDGVDVPGRKRWSRHGSTRWLFQQADVVAAIRYVVEQQGQPMAVYVAEG